MKESKITYEDIKKICEKILSQGLKPTPTVVRQMIGVGSFTTITAHIRAWEQTLPKVELQTSDIDEAMRNACKKLVESRVAVGLSELQKQIETLTQDKDAVMSESLQYLSQCEKLEIQLTDKEKMVIENAKTIFSLNERIGVLIAENQKQIELIELFNKASIEAEKQIAVLSAKLETFEKLQKENEALKAELAVAYANESANANLTIMLKQLIADKEILEA